MHTLLIAKSLSLFQTLWCSLCCPACLCYLGADLPELIASNSNSDSWSVPATSPYYPMGSVAGSYELLNVKSALATAVFLFTAACSQNASDFTPPKTLHLKLMWAAFCCWSCNVFGAWLYLPPSIVSPDIFSSSCQKSSSPHCFLGQVPESSGSGDTNWPQLLTT